MVAIDQQKIIDFIRMKGPILPVHLAKFIGTDILIASAHLSDLTSTQKIFISHTKVGGSPVYYTDGQQAKLQEFSKHLNEKDQRAFAYLKEKKILRDRDLSPLMRVAMQAIKDFAVPLQVSSSAGTETFWKWYMLDEEDAKKEINRLLEASEVQRKLTEAAKPVEERKPVAEASTIQSSLQQTTKPIVKVSEPVAAQPATEELKPREPEQKPEERKFFREEKPRKRIEERKPEKKAVAREKPIPEKIITEKPKKEVELKAEMPEIKPQEAVEDAFLDKVIGYLANKGIIIVESKIIKKKSELDLVIRVPSAVGMIEQFCKAKNKKRVNEGDLNSAYVQGQIRKMPVLMIATGEPAKKAREMLDKDFKGLVFLKM